MSKPPPRRSKRSPFRRAWRAEEVEFRIARVGGAFCRRYEREECDPYSGNVWTAPASNPRRVRLARVRAENARLRMSQPTDGGRLEVRQRTIPAGYVLTMRLSLEDFPGAN